MTTHYYVRLVAGSDTDSPLFTKFTTFAGHIPTVGDQLVLRHRQAPEKIYVPAVVVDVTWRADFTALEVTVEAVTEEWDVKRVIDDGTWTPNRTAKPKPKGDPRIDQDDD